MPDVKKIVHQSAMAVRNVAFKLFPDRLPLTFVGADSSAQLCQAIAQTGAKKVLLVTDAGLVKIGIVAKISEALEKTATEVVLYDGVEPDPTFAQVEEGLRRYRSEGCDAILAVGGGSPMDASKAIAALATNNKPARKLEGLLKVRQPPAPLFAVPTTAGTGSEVTIAAVVSDTDTHTKKFFVDPKLIPLMTALDPSLMLGLPPAITAATGMDALTHAIESYLCTSATRQSEAYALTSVRMVFANLPTAYRDGNDFAARSAMALASYYGGAAFTRTGVGYVHAIAHAFGAYYGTPHGLANAIVLPNVLEFSKEPAQRRLAELADAIVLGGSREEERADRFIEAVRKLMADVEIPYTLDALEARDIPSIATQALAEAYLNYPVPRFMNQDECEALLRRMLP